GHGPGEVSVAVAGAGDGERHTVGVDPRALGGDTLPRLPRPRLLAIVSSHVLAAYLARSPRTRPDGFVLESPVAGGHSAPPRGRMALDERGEPVYGPRDAPDLAKVAAIGLPFWLAGGYGTADRLAAAAAAGAAGLAGGPAR